MLILKILSACQTAHWKTHKRLCKSFKGAKWETVPFMKHPSIYGEVVEYTTFDSRRGMPPSSAREHPSPSRGEPPANVHDTRPFIIKIQRPLPLSPEQAAMEAAAGIPSDLMLIYDRQRSFRVCFTRSDAPAVYGKAMHTIVNDPVCGGLKTYRWARRIDDWKLSVCFDISPEPMPGW